jgi:hypothetical protein
MVSQTLMFALVVQHEGRDRLRAKNGYQFNDKTQSEIPSLNCKEIEMLTRQNKKDKCSPFPRQIGNKIKMKIKLNHDHLPLSKQSDW